MNTVNRVVITLVLIFISAFVCQSQTISTTDKYNLDFERIENGIPTGWQVNTNSEDCLFSLDSTVVKNGKYSAAIEYDGELNKFGISGLIISDNYDGKQITLSGYIKTENVVSTNGYASLFLRIDPEIGFKDVQIKGTTEWKRYEVTVPMYPKETRNFVIGVVLRGKGKVWFDDLKITIDGKDINELSTIESIKFDNSSGIIIDQLSDTQIKDLTILGLMWGFLKYYHPNVAKGNYNWDYELFKMIPEILNSKNNVQRDEIFADWITGLGEFTESKEDINPNLEIKLKPDLDWINNSGFSNNLSSLLTRVKNANRTEENHYIGRQIYGNLEFKNEKQYSNIVYPDAGFRLLALFRYWNIIQYFFPYKYLIEEDWKKVLKEFIPKIVDTKNEIEYTLTVSELIGRIHDSHAYILPNNQILINYFGKYYAPLELTFIENKPIVTGYFNEKLGKATEMEIGDILTKINNVKVEDKIKNISRYTAASNSRTQFREIARNLLRTNDTIINIEYIRDNKIHNKEIKVYADNELNIYGQYVNDTCFKMINEEIAYLNNGSLKKSYLPQIWEKIKNTKGLIIDNRNYPSDHPIYELGSYLMPKPTPFIKFSSANITQPGLFANYWGTVSIGKENNDYYKGKVIILVNENTQSSAETHTMGYKVHPNAMVIGSSTAGANGDISTFYLPGGIYTTISGNGIYYPDGRETQRIGIVPDIETKPTIKGIKEGRDEVLEKAIEIINQ